MTAIAGVVAILTACSGSPVPSDTPAETAEAAAALPIVEGSADYEGVSSTEELVARGATMVRARAVSARESEFSYTGPADPNRIPATMTSFELIETVWGNAERNFEVTVTGGVMERQGKRYVLEMSEEPAFEIGATYLLILEPRNNHPGQHFTVGPAAGRYKIKAGRLASVEDDAKTRGGHEGGDHDFGPVVREIVSLSPDRAKTVLKDKRDKHVKRQAAAG